jgi:hypothetical protein
MSRQHFEVFAVPQRELLEAAGPSGLASESFFG